MIRMRHSVRGDKNGQTTKKHAARSAAIIARYNTQALAAGEGGLVRHMASPGEGSAEAAAYSQQLDVRRGIVEAQRRYEDERRTARRARARAAASDR